MTEPSIKVAERRRGLFMVNGLGCPSYIHRKNAAPSSYLKLAGVISNSFGSTGPGFSSSTFMVT